MAITFRVNLETVGLYGHRQPYNPISDTNFPETRSTFFPDNILNNRVFKHGDEFDVSGLKAIYLRDNYTSGPYKFLDVVSGSP